MNDKNISTILASVSTFIGLSQIQSVLGILLTLINIGIIVYNLIYKLINHIKNKETDKIKETLEETYDKLNKLQEEIKENENED